VLFAKTISGGFVLVLEKRGKLDGDFFSVVEE
jgi:hypothetical protein